MNKSPTILPGTGVPTQYVVVWEWENRPNRWRPYSPEATQLLERAHSKKLNKFYLKDADPLLSEYAINMTTFEQICERTGAVYPVRREFYPSTCPAGKGAKWEWGGDTTTDWHIYDMEVQVVIEEAWSRGDQTIDISKHFPGCPYIMNFCNLTQVRTNSGVVRPIRRMPQPAYPMVKLTQAEIASMIHRKEERRKEMLLELERRQNLQASVSGKKKKKDFHMSKEIVGEKSKKAVKHLMNQIFHSNKDGKAGSGSSEKERKEIENTLRRKSTSSSTNLAMAPPLSKNPTRAALSASSHNLSHYPSGSEPRVPQLHHRQASESSPLRNGHFRPPQSAGNTPQYRRGAAIGPPNSSSAGSSSEFGYPVIGRRSGVRPGYQQIGGGQMQHQQQQNGRYRRIQDSSFSSFSDTGSASIVRRPSVDTISTYLSESHSQHNNRSHRNSFYGGSLGSQELLDIYGDEDSVFDDETGSYIGDSVSMVGPNPNYLQQQRQIEMSNYNGARSRAASSTRPAPPPTRGTIATPPRQRILSDPSLAGRSHYLPSPPGTQPQINQYSMNGLNPPPASLSSQDYDDQGGSDLYVNQRDLAEEIRGQQQQQQQYRYGDARSNGSVSPGRAWSESRHLTSPQMPLNQRSSSSSTRRALFQSQGSINHSRDPSALSDGNYSTTSSNSNLLPKSPSKNPGIKKRPVPTPRTILNTTDDTLSQASSSTTAGGVRRNSASPKYTPIDQLVMKYSQFVIDPNSPDESCHICHILLDEPSPCNENDLNVICLTLCHHKFHLSCLKSLVENQPGGPNYIQCPSCHTVSGEKWGDMPNNGSMTYKIVPKGLPGFEDYHAIQITYNFQNGIQGSNHPLPGQPFYAIGFPKTAFLPDTEKGRSALGNKEKSTDFLSKHFSVAVFSFFSRDFQPTSKLLSIAS